MKLIVHCGLPKCGSTSLQNSFTENRLALERAGIHYPAGGTFASNHEEFAALIRAGSPEASRAKFAHLTVTELQFARERNLNTVLLSSEDFIFGTENDEVALGFTHILTTISRQCGASVSLVIVLRDARAFLRSYLLQQIANGTSLDVPNSGQLLNFFYHCIRRLIDCKFPTYVLSLHATEPHGGVVSSFYNRILGLDDPAIAERHDNIISSRTVATEALIGVICRTYAHLCGEHINSPIVDTKRRTLRNLVDEHSITAPVGVFIDRLEKETKPILEEYELQILRSSSSECMNFWQQLVEAPVTRFNVAHET